MAENARPKDATAVAVRVPIDPERVKYFQKEIERSDTSRDQKFEDWGVEDNIKRYLPPDPGDATVHTGVDFSDVQVKIAGIFYDCPRVHVKPHPEGDAAAAVLHTELLNTVLHEINVKATSLKCLQDCLVAIQPSFSKIGYIPTIVDVDQPVTRPVLDPLSGAMTQQPVIDEKGKPVTQKVPVVIHEEFFWTRVSGKSGLLPVDFKDTDYDKSSWIGYRWRKPTSQVIREYGLPEGWKAPSGGDKQVTFTDEQDRPDEGGDPPVTGVYIEYRAADIDPKIQHPALRRCLVLIDGLDQPVKHENVGWQTIDEATSMLTPDSPEGSMIHPLALRDLPDSGWVPADASLTGPLTKEIDSYRTKTARQRDGSKLVFTYDAARLDPEAKTKIESGKNPGEWIDGVLWVPVQSGAIEAGKNMAIAQVPTLEQGRESYLGQDYMQADRDRILGINANRAGGAAEGDSTATENALAQRNSDARFNQEQARMLEDWFLRGAKKLSALLVRFGDRFAMRILGPQRGKAWVQFKNAGKLGQFSYELQLDSGKYLDVRAERKQWLDFYNLTAKDPNTRRVVILKKLASAWGLDPNEFVVEQLPEPKPEPPKVNFTISLDQFNPTLPQFPIAVEVVRQLGIAISDTTIQLAQQQAQTLPMAGRNTATGEAPNDPVEAMNNSLPAPTSGVGPDPKAQQSQQHGGPADPADRINQHQLALTGNMSGPGVAAP